MNKESKNDLTIDLAVNQIALQTGTKHHKVLGHCCNLAISDGLINVREYYTQNLTPMEFMDKVIADFKRLPLNQIYRILHNTLSKIKEEQNLKN